MKRKANYLDIKEIPVDKSANHPDPTNNVLPKHEFTMGIIAPKGSGKTTLICNMLNYYKKYFHLIIVFSPTVKNDEKWDWVKDQPLLVENTPLKTWFKKIEMKKGTIVDKPPPDINSVSEKYLNDRKDDNNKFDGKIPEEHFYHTYEPSDLIKIVDEQQQVINLLKEYGQTKHLAHRILLLCDDMVGSTLFGADDRNPFKMLNIAHRHLSTSIIMVSQAYKEIPKTIRTNFSCLILFEILSDNELHCIREEYPMGMKKKQWAELYNYAVDTPYSFLFYNMQKPRELRIMKNFKEILLFKKEKAAQF